LKSHKFYCPDAKGDESFLLEENFEPWVQVRRGFLAFVAYLTNGRTIMTL